MQGLKVLCATGRRVTLLVFTERLELVDELNAGSPQLLCQALQSQVSHSWRGFGHASLHMLSWHFHACKGLHQPCAAV